MARSRLSSSAKHWMSEFVRGCSDMEGLLVRPIHFCAFICVDFMAPWAGIKLLLCSFSKGSGRHAVRFAAWRPPGAWRARESGLSGGAHTSRSTRTNQSCAVLSARAYPPARDSRIQEENEWGTRPARLLVRDICLRHETFSHCSAILRRDDRLVVCSGHQKDDCSRHR